MLERVFVCLLAGGHLLIEGVPGLAKTLTVKTVADVFGGRFERIQFTPDLVPADLVGTRMYRQRQRDVRHRARAGVLQLPARRRDQPRARQGAVGAARGDAGAPGHDRQGDLPGAGAVPRDGDAEPDRVRGHVPAARGAGRPLHAQDRRRLPARGGRADRDRAGARRPDRRSSSSSRSRSSPSCRRRRGASTSTRPSRATRSRSRRDPPARPTAASASSREYVSLRRQPARPDQPRARRPRARRAARPPLRAAAGRARAREGRAAPPDGAELRGARRGRRRRHDARPRARGDRDAGTSTSRAGPWRDRPPGRSHRSARRPAPARGRRRARCCATSS